MKEEKFNLELNVLQLQVILKGLEELPLKHSKPVYDNVISQYQAIQEAAQKAAIHQELDKPKMIDAEVTPE